MVAGNTRETGCARRARSSELHYRNLWFMTVAIYEPVSVPRSESEPQADVRNLRYKTLRTLLWAVVLLAAAETTVRLRAYFRHGSNAPVANIYESDELLGRRPRPGATLDGKYRQLSINQWGFRGADFPADKPAGTIRVAVAGDSTSFGMEAASDETVWPARTMALLNEQAGAAQRYDIINGGVPGYTLPTSTLQLTERIASFDPDVVVIYQVGTDLAAHARREFSPPSSKADTNQLLGRFAQRNSLLVNLVRVNTAAFRSRRALESRHDRLDQRGIEEYRQRLIHLLDLCAERDWRVILCTCPRSFGDPDAPTDQYTLATSALANNPMLSLKCLNDAYERYNQEIRSVAREWGITLVDLDAIVPRRVDYFSDAVHLTDAGHELVGRAVAEAIVGFSAEREADGL